MASNVQNPALAARGNAMSSLAGSKIDTEYAPSLIDQQALRLTRRCAISFAMAAIVAPLIFGEVSNGQ